MQAPVLVLNQNTQRECGRKAQLGNISAGKAIADIIRTTLGPRSMLKMILDPMGGIVMTNDGNAILREIDVSHPAAKTMIELSRTQDEEVGDGTTSVIVLTGALLENAIPFLEQNMHPRVIVGAYMRALDDALEAMDQVATSIDTENPDDVLRLVNSCLGTKFTSRFGDQLARMAIDAVSKVTLVNAVTKKKEIDVKRYARVEKIPGAFFSDSMVLNGLLLNKDVVFPRMRRRIENPRILLLDCPLEFKKGESQTNIEVSRESDWDMILKQEEAYIRSICDDIISVKPDLVFTEKGCSDLAQHFLMKANISVIRRVRKTDNNRIARATGATICHDTHDIRDCHIGQECGLFEVRKIGDEYFTYLVECKDPKACTIILRGASKDVLNEMERNLYDAMYVVRNAILDPRVVPGGGACELAMGRYLQSKSKTLSGVDQWPYKSVANSLEVIPRTLIENCGSSVIRLLTKVRAKHALFAQNAKKGEEFKCSFGIDGNKGAIADMDALGVIDPYVVKAQTLKTAIEAACMLLRIDDIVSGMTAKQGAGKAAVIDDDDDNATFGDSRDG